jgi:nucleoside-diphosphate-sugar epimerase
MKAFVTGATGLLGNNLVRTLRARGHTVRALVRSETKARELLGGTGAEIVRGDMENVSAFTDALAGCDVVFHTAAYFREYYSAGDHWPKLEAVNVRATLALAEAARAQGVRRFVHTSSNGTIGIKGDGSPGDEDTPPAPIARRNLYFKSKVVVAAKLRELVESSGLDVVEVLPGWMFGPWDAAPTSSGRLVRDFLDRKLTGIPPGGMNVIDARDVATGMIGAAEQGRSGERYLLAGPFQTLKEIVATLGHVTGLPVSARPIPYPVALAYATVAQNWARFTGGRTLATVAGVRMLNARLQVSSAKAKQELGWSHRSLLDTLRDEVSWYRSYSRRGDRAAEATTAVA